MTLIACSPDTPRMMTNDQLFAAIEEDTADVELVALAKTDPETAASELDYGANAMLDLAASPNMTRKQRATYIAIAENCRAYAVELRARFCKEAA